MGAHSSIPAWGIPWTEEPGRLQSRGVARVGYDLVTKPLSSPEPYNRIVFSKKEERNLVLIQATTRMNFENMINERSPT